MNTANNLEKDFCLACNEVVDYEIDGDNKHCSVCGRTKGAAEIFVKKNIRAKSVINGRNIITIAFIVLCLGVGFLLVVPNKMFNISNISYDKILLNCIIDKSKYLPDSAVHAVRSICGSIAFDPSFIDKIKYGF